LDFLLLPALLIMFNKEKIEEVTDAIDDEEKAVA
jgi:hypothetical protein